MSSVGKRQVLIAPDIQRDAIERKAASMGVEIARWTEDLDKSGTTSDAAPASAPSSTAWRQASRAGLTSGFLPHGRANCLLVVAIPMRLVEDSSSRPPAHAGGARATRSARVDTDREGLGEERRLGDPPGLPS